MRVSLSWLKKYVNLGATTPEELKRALPMIGLDVESLEVKGLPPLPEVVVGEILMSDKHPNADKLSVCTVKTSLNEPPRQIVCGAKNYKVGDRVPVALPGAKLPGDFVIKRSKLRGVESEGMMCSAKELGLGDDHGGLMILQNRPEIGTPINQLFPEPDAVFTLELTANRGDCWSHVGVARELAALYGQKLSRPAPKSVLEARPAPGPGHLLTALQVTSPDCPYYTAAAIRGVKIGPSPDWLKRDLEAAGLRAINNVVDVTNWVMLELGQPLHAFDAKKIGGVEIVVRAAHAGEKITTLDGKERVLDPSVLVIADNARALVVAGVMGSIDAEVDAATTDIVLESAWFRPAAIRRATRLLGLHTDSSQRFARDVDPAGVLLAARRAIDLILETAGGELVPHLAVHGAPPRGDNVIEVTPDFVRERLGFAVDDAQIRGVFERLGFGIANGHAGAPWRVTIPSAHGDITRPIDLVEEFLRIHGTDKIPATAVAIAGGDRDDDAQGTFGLRAAEFLAARQFAECVHYSIRDGAEMPKWQADTATAALTLANPLTTEMSHLRPTLVPGLLEALRRNADHGNGLPRLAECGRVFRENDGVLSELEAVAFIIPATTGERSWKQTPAPDFYAAKGLATLLAAHLLGADIAALDFQPIGPRPLWQSGHAAESGCWVKNGFQIKCGLVSLALTKEKGLDGLVYAGELLVRPDFLAKQKIKVRFQPFSSFPTSTRDLALVVDETAAAETVRRDVEAAAKAATAGAFAVESVTIFDLYQGEGLPPGKKSLACALRFRSLERTLKDDEVNTVFAKVQQAVTTDGKYAVRS
ncbi:MAG TPA: phenylalanine--tRNA ligase subunit beta [Opitutales bacterium]|nr:phenylalanine--tRNA ligase subunit beta [Opitutales bacterium]